MRPSEPRTTYDLATVPMGGIRCRLCGRTSWLPRDVKEKYCGACHLFHDVVGEARIMLVNGGSHECGEWQTARGMCALCAPCLQIRFQQHGGHVHCRVFAASRPDTTFAKCGELVFSVDEWPDVCALLGRAAEILPEDAGSWP